MELLLYYIFEMITFIYKDTVFQIDLHQRPDGKYYYELTEFLKDGRRRIYKVKYEVGTPFHKNSKHIIDYFEPQIDHYYAVDATLEALVKLLKSDSMKDKNVFKEYMRFTREMNNNDDSTFERHISKKHAVPYVLFKVMMYGYMYEIELRKATEPLQICGIECPYYFEISSIRRGERHVLPRKIHLEIADEYRNRRDFLLDRIGRMIDDDYNANLSMKGAA